MFVAPFGIVGLLRRIWPPTWRTSSPSAAGSSGEQ